MFSYIPAAARNVIHVFLTNLAATDILALSVTLPLKVSVLNLQHPVRRSINSDWCVISFTIIAYEDFFKKFQSELNKFSHRQPLRTSQN